MQSVKNQVPKKTDQKKDYMKDYYEEQNKFCGKRLDPNNIYKKEEINENL